MKSRLITPLLLAGGLALAGAASATPWSWTGTLADWAASADGTGVVTDADGDMQFTLFSGSTSIPDRPGTPYITLSEIEIGNKDYYDVSMNWGPNGWAGSGQLAYTLQVLGATNERITGASLDSAITGDGTTSLMILRDLPDNTILDNLSSINGARDPSTGMAEFSGRSLLGVQQVFQPSTTGVYQDSHAGFVVTVPEPGAMSLVGLGLFGILVFSRRKA